MATIAKHLVSKKKRRFIEDGFDLDMTFITRNIVAMGFPAEGREGIYRNNMRDVKRFFDTRHRDHYKIYNLCSERDYDPNKFYGRVVKFPFDDHNAPPFQLIEKFCEDVAEYLERDSRNVAVIHCKAGKGRTGVMITAFLLHLRLFTDTNEALEFYGHARTMNGKGVTIPSQVRYVHYYGRLLRSSAPYEPRMLIMRRIVLRGIPDMSNGTCVPQFVIKQLNYKSSWYEGITREQSFAELDLPAPLPVCGDIKLEFIHRKSTGKEKMFHLWFNTFFIDDLKFVAQQSEIDKANKDKKNKIFPVGFSVEIDFLNPQEDEEAASVVQQQDGVRGAGVVAPTATAATTAQQLQQQQQGEQGASSATAAAKGKGVVARAVPAPLNAQDSTISQAPEWSDSDLTTTDEDEDDWEGLPISDV
ncbi:hypothetical protein PTSG_10560 [Salpingoeca rosetta]|uniref:Phosphatidylinositol 3,4,5-trisphosphate 3-phosphatase and dual-specificity protein phosphatase PTEN n=1 Tax=Salpingoeca rosetta (strain ATCC 50818 / BSB-021) TaxID=946362 RepID=F2URQ0_SALR5|nr:uncharacterized protein PTSG_10560 [Salpingoeca rosetta]EGD80305.1 hypothetical protein PTSG_10560 [Salpingoeca rosetta]|eukprot:XP_004988095.1 hypothetical protein PTSG_10560 [Salpingoeca rosetta]